jgi:hypothetical protein
MKDVADGLGPRAVHTRCEPGPIPGSATTPPPVCVSGKGPICGAGGPCIHGGECLAPDPRTCSSCPLVPDGLQKGGY